MNAFARTAWLGLAAGAACLYAAAAGAADLKLALDCPPDPERCGTYRWAQVFTRELEAGGMTVTQFERGALGGEAERLDQVSQGLLEVSMSDVKQAGRLDKFIFGVFAPYLFDDLRHLDRVLNDGGLLARINQGTTPKGVRVLAVVTVGGPAGIFNTKHPVETVADMADLRMRALDEAQIALFEAWGTTGVVVSMAEVPNALQTGVADGYLNPSAVPLILGHTDFIKYFTDARIASPLRAVLASEYWYQGLSDQERGLVDAAVAVANEDNRTWLEKNGDKPLAQLEQAGVRITELSPEARAGFVAKSKLVYDDLMPAKDMQLWLDAAETYR